jgi:hypothetical protein
MNNVGVSIRTGQAFESASSGRDVRPHKCAACFNPFTREGNSECPRRKDDK